MSFYDADILIQNIQKLMKNNNVTQQSLANTLGMSQSNVSKALSSKDKKNFTFDQIVGIAKHFHVSIDSLVGHTTTNSELYSPRYIAQFLSDCVANEYAKFSSIQIEEEVFEPSYDGFHYPNVQHENRLITYPVIYFPNYWSIWDYSNDYDAQQEAIAEAEQVGNETRNVPINEFLKKFEQIHTVYSRGELAEEAYNIVVSDYLRRLKDSNF